MWEYLGGKWGPRSTSDARRRYLRATPIPGEMFAWALVAGLLSVIALVGYWIVLFQVVKVPGNGLPDYSKYPPLTVAAVLLMASLVSSLAEEAGFRGYFQGILEQTLRSPLAIVISSLVIAPAHALTQGFFWSTMLWYFAVDMVFGGLAYITKSIWPGTVVHAIGLMIFFTLVWPNDAQRRPVWETGADVWFWINVAQALVFTGLAAAAFSRLRSVTKRLHAAQSNDLTPTLNQ
jgi:membrane protease YdiL (CAAX protease family)